MQFFDKSEWEGPWDDSTALLIGRDGQPIEGSEGLKEQHFGGDMLMMPARASHWPGGVPTTWRTPTGTKWEGEFISLDFEPSKARGMFVIREPDGVNFYDGYVVDGKRSGFGR